MMKIQEVSSSSSTHPWKHHVFLSFRGEDTRNNFTGHLCSALRREGIITFMDDQLKRGEEISSALVQAIEESKISIIVFSEKYASSKWCLDELVKILECKRSNQQDVRPVFYKVDPSDIRNHRGSFGKALAKHERRFKDNPDKIQKWKAALSEAANLSGWPLLDGKCSESCLIRDIVGEISKQLINRTYLDVSEYSIGIQPRVQKIIKLLDVEGRDVHFVGIWGPGGIGKTTIAKSVYNSIFHAFEGSYFLESVREKSMGAKGFVKVQQTLLSQILQDTVKVSSVGRGVNMIKERLHNRRVLLVLDDVNDVDQLKNLACESRWFGNGSKIIITTRDMKLLRGHSIDFIYKVEELDHDEAFDVFCMNAFKSSQPLDGFAELTELAIRYAQGLPLALTVLGSHLCNENVEVWQATLEVFKSRKIQEVLKISYDGLETELREAFLDIACFFKGELSEHVIKILEACGHKHAEILVIKVLKEKALISIRQDGRIWMHDLLEEMGRDIVHNEWPNDPENRSRLWFHEDVSRVLVENIGTSNIRGIKVDLPKDSDVICLSETTFSNMKKLKLLIYRGGCYFGVVDHMPNSLRVVDWSHCHIQLFHSNSFPRDLAVMNMPGSHITVMGLGDVYKHLNLTSINLSECQFLTKVTDLSGCPNLQSLNLDWCCNLVEVHPSVGFLDKLNYLSLDRCSVLETIPREVNWKSMRSLQLPYCPRLKTFIEIVDKMESIKQLNLYGSGIEELHSWIGRCTSLEVLLLDATPLRELPSSIGNLTSLESLSVSITPLKELPSSIGNLTSLKRLYVFRTPLKELPSSIGCLTSLENLDVSITLLKELPSSIGNLTSLERLYVSETPLKELPSSIGHLTSLERLYVSETPLKELHSSIGCLTSLRALNMSRTLLKELPSSIGCLTSLTALNMSGTLLKELPSSIGCLTSLMELDVSGTPLKELSSSIGNLTSLKDLDASETDIEELPWSIGNLNRLRYLYLKGCANLKNVPHSVYGGLQRLEKLRLSGCPKLVRFPSRVSASSAESLPTNSNNKNPASLLFPLLQHLEFEGCNLSVSDFLTNLDCASALKRLNLSGSSLDSVPACIIKFHWLEFLNLSGCQRLRDILGLPPNAEVCLRDCVLLERFSKLSNILEQKDSLKGLPRRMDLSNCNRLLDNIGMDMVLKMAKALLNQLRSGFDHSWYIKLSSLPGVEVQKWFDRGELEISVYEDEYDMSQLLIKIPRSWKGKRIGLVVCAVFDVRFSYTNQNSSYAGFNQVEFVTNGTRYRCSGVGHVWLSKGAESSAHDNQSYVCLPCFDFNVVDHVVRVTFKEYVSSGWLLKSYGAHLVEKEDDASGEDMERERCMQGSAATSDDEEDDSNSDDEEEDYSISGQLALHSDDEEEDDFFSLYSDENDDLNDEDLENMTSSDHSDDSNFGQL